MEKDRLVVRVRRDRRTNLVELTDKGNEKNDSGCYDAGH